MKAQNFNLDSYLRRIGLAGPVGASLESLTAMMRAQLFAVPFENLDVQAGRGVSLVPEDIVAKIVDGGRGGYCYEVNGLFANALEALHVPYSLVAARPMFYPVRRPRTHMAIVAEVEGRSFLFDLGFGSYGIRAPMPLDTLDTPVVQDNDAFMLLGSEDGRYLLRALVDGEWTNQYEFDLSPQEYIDFAPANYLNSTHPDAIFVQKLLVIRHDERGRAILLGNRFKTVRDGRSETVEVSGAQTAELLESVFGLPPVAG